jgi:hypothetical protein
MSKTLTTIVTAIALFWNVGVMANEHTPKLFEIASEQCAKNHMQNGFWAAIDSAACKHHEQMFNSFVDSNKGIEQMVAIEAQICDFEEEYMDDPTCFDWAPQQTSMSEQIKVFMRNFNLVNEAWWISFEATKKY